MPRYAFGRLPDAFASGPGAVFLRRGVREAGLERGLFGIATNERVALSPGPVLGQLDVEALGTAREGDPLGAHVRRHHREQIVVADQAIQHVHDGPPRGM